MSGLEPRFEVHLPFRKALGVGAPLQFLGLGDLADGLVEVFVNDVIPKRPLLDDGGRIGVTYSTPKKIK